MRTFYVLAKPGIIYGNALPFVAAFILAVQPTDLVRLLIGLIGQSLIIGGACVFNNMLDRGIDERMARTRTRALVIGLVRMRAAGLYGTVLCVGGLLLLFYFANLLTVGIGLAGILLYVLAYGYAKRHTPWSTLIGSIPGALPPVAGYAAAVGQLDATAALLGLILVFWQMAHFYAIALYRAKDYAAAKLPVLPVVASAQRVRLEIMLYALALLCAVLALGWQARLSLVYVLLTSAICAWWLVGGVVTWRRLAPKAWARRMFFRSLSVLLVICVAIPLGVWTR